MRRRLQTLGSSGRVGAAGGQGGEQREREGGRKRREPGRLAESARRAASGSQVPVGTAAASRPARALLTPPPLTLSRSLHLPQERSLGSGRDIPSLNPVTGGVSGTQEPRVPAGHPLWARSPRSALLLPLLLHLRPHQLQLGETPPSRGGYSRPGVTH